jgi:hypothetical protein
MRDAVAALRARLSDYRKDRFLRRRRRRATAPYPLSIYRDLCRRVAAGRVVNPPFAIPARPRPRELRVFLRHDVDTALCTTRLRAIADANLETGTRAGIFFRVDDEEYRMRDHRALAAELYGEGFEVGLHTACYVDDDYLGRLRREAEKFANEVGFAPSTFTVHGLGLFRWEVRQRFYEEIADCLAKFGFAFSDCHPSLRAYDYVIEDCHRDTTTGARFIYEDFERLPLFLRPAHDYLVLTHPCYWSPGLP